MRTPCIAIFAAALLCGVSLAQQASPNTSGSATDSAQTAPQTSQPNTNTASPNMSGLHSMRIAPGSVIPVQLTKGIDAKKAKAGDEVEARVTIDMKANNGEVVVPKDTKVMGHVTEAQAHTKDQRESQIGLAFDHAVTKDGQNVSLPMSVQAIISPQALNQGNSNSNDSAPAASNSSASQPSPATQPGGMGGNMSPNRAPSSSATAGEPEASSGNNSGNNHSTPPITGNTQGVVGISDITLSAGQGNEGSVVTSDKKNVKLDNGTLMLLRVNQQQQVNQQPANQPQANQPQQ
jgi:hypothetical protein